ncbi:sugar ABC transporter substrate-binding protein, partial [Leuconostoc falkenbergense]|nr:sugar ABC transporter substrate-binding protein [Leuconostoc falkenbergense]
MRKMMSVTTGAMVTLLTASTAVGLLSVSIDTPTVSAAKTKKLKLWVDTDTKPTYVQAVKDFEKANPSVKVTIKYTSSTDALKNLQKDP